MKPEVLHAIMTGSPGVRRAPIPKSKPIDLEREIKSIARKFALHFGWDRFRQRHQAESIRRMLSMLQFTQALGAIREKESGEESRSVRRARRAADARK